MATANVYNWEGKSIGNVDLDEAVFGVTVNPTLVQFVARAQRANAHVPYAHTKTRGEVRGGGRKPWKQKGTGRARQGSIRSPQWRGGGIVFGPRNILKSPVKVNQRVRRQAIRMMLSNKVASEALVVVDSMDGISGKTKQLANSLQKLPAHRSSTLIASGKKHEQLTRAARNLPRVNTTLTHSVNVGDLLRYRYLLVDRDGINQLTKQFKDV